MLYHELLMLHNSKKSEDIQSTNTVEGKFGDSYMHHTSITMNTAIIVL